MSILADILVHKKAEIAALDARALRLQAEVAPAPRDFLSLLVRSRSRNRPALIAELKRASPSKGLLAPQLDLLQIADLYAGNGAAAISVLTDRKYFLGELEVLRRLRFERSCGLPLLRKDFIIQEAQVYESRLNGADAVLLIAAAFKDRALFAGLHALALALGLTPLVEVHNEAEIERVLKIDNLHMIGINNRDLASFRVSLETTETLRPLIPPGIAVVAESGIFTAQDVARLADAGVDAVLVGEALVTSADIPSKVRELAGFER